MKKQRQSNIELLRIISILFIISFHYAYKCSYNFEEFTVNKFIIKAFYMFGELGVNLFFLITGYFMCKGKFSFKKIIKLTLETYFYSLISIFIMYKLGIYETNTKTIISMIFPINAYWFLKAYILLLFVSPFLNILIENMDKKTYQNLLLITLIIWCVIPTIFGVLRNGTESIMFYSRFIWAIIMYFVGAYIRIYSLKLINSIKKSSLIAIVTFCIMLLSIVVIQKYNVFFAKIGLKEIAYFWTPNTILEFLLSISIFSIFLKIKIKNNVIINTLASTTLGIYILHEGLLSKYIWNDVFKTQNYATSNFLILHILFTTAVIFIVGAIIDLIRQFIEKNTVNKFLDSKVSTKISNKFNKLMTKIYDFI